MYTNYFKTNLWLRHVLELFSRRLVFFPPVLIFRALLYRSIREMPTRPHLAWWRISVPLRPNLNITFWDLLLRYNLFAICFSNARVFCFPFLKCTFWKPILKSDFLHSQFCLVECYLASCDVHVTASFMRAIFWTWHYLHTLHVLNSLLFRCNCL